MPDDDRTRRRLGDATRSRIADLASGWSVDAPIPAPLTPDPDAPDPTAPEPDAPDPTPVVAPAPTSSGPTRAKPRTNPPPPPGSAERRALEDKIVSTKSRDDESTDVVPPARRATGAQPTVKPPPTPPRATGPQPIVTSAASSTASGRVKTPSAPPPPPGSPARTKAASVPPPPPGSVERAKQPTAPPPRTRAPSIPSFDLAMANVRAKTASVPPPLQGPDSGRTKPPSVPPPASRAKPASIPPAAPAAIPAPPSGPKFPRATYDGPAGSLAVDADEPRPFASEQRTPAVIVDTDAFVKPAPPRAVPTGEFDRAADTMDQRTIRRDPSIVELTDGELVEDDDDHDDERDTNDPDEDRETNAPDADAHDASAPHAHDADADDADAHEDDDNDEADDAHEGHRAPSADEIEQAYSGFRARGEPAVAELKTEKFERGDPTQNAPPDATEIQAPRAKHMTGGTLRRSAALRRKRGLYGDVRYVFTAMFGVRRSRHELGELEHRQQVREVSRRRHLITAGRSAATMDNFDHPALGRSRDTLASIEDERAKHAGAVAASDAELDRVRRDRETATKAHADARTKADAEIAEVAKKLEPLEKEASAARKRAAELRDELGRIDKKIADTEALLVSVKGEKLDKAGVRADIATFKANKQAVLRDEPQIAAELDGLNPRIAALEATRADLVKKKTELDKADQEDHRRTLELLDAIGAKRKVVERASADAETARDNALFELGERLYNDRPKQLTPQLSPIDRIDLEIGEDERRAMELREILSNIDKAKFARGLAMIILALAAIGSVTWWILSLTA